ncbi:hypothetical protein BGLA2_1230025 [Burkholderia gladioli]|nr:hypothetical protein BGLA2_1230025 [Burkholderia gladioli]
MQQNVAMQNVALTFILVNPARCGRSCYITFDCITLRTLRRFERANITNLTFLSSQSNDSLTGFS